MIKSKLQVSNGYDLNLSLVSRLLQWVAETRPARWSQAAAGEAVGIPARAIENVAQSARLAEDTSHIGLQGGYQASRIDGVWRYHPTGDSSVNIPRGD